MFGSFNSLPAGVSLSGGLNALTGGTGLANLGDRPLVTPPRADYNRDRIASDIINYPWKGPGELQNYAGETTEMRWQFRRAALSNPTLQAALEGLPNQIASLDVSVISADEHSPREDAAAELCNWVIDNCAGGWEGLFLDMLWAGAIDGWSMLEPRFEGKNHPKFGAVTGLKHIRSLDTTWLKVEMDPYRNIQGIVSLRRGLEIFDPSMVLLYTNRKLFEDPFGNSDVRPVLRDANLLEDTFRLWYLALRMYGEPYFLGKCPPTFQQDMSIALADLQGGRFATLTQSDPANPSTIELLNLSAATPLQAFETLVNKLREQIFLSTRGAYLPFLEGQGGEDAHANTKIHKGASDAKADIRAKMACRVVQQHLFPMILKANFAGPVGVPRIQLGGIDWAESKSMMDAVEKKISVGGDVSVSYLNTVSRLPGPKDPSDSLVAQKAKQAAAMPAPGMPGPGGAMPPGNPAAPGAPPTGAGGPPDVPDANPAGPPPPSGPAALPAGPPPGYTPEVIAATIAAAMAKVRNQGAV